MDCNGWSHDATYVGTEKDEIQSTHFDVINKVLENYGADPRVKGDP